MFLIATQFKRVFFLIAALSLIASWSMAADNSAPQPPKLRHPEDNAVLRNFPRQVTFQWKDVSDRSGVTYFIQIDTNYPKPTGGSEWRRQVFGPLRDNTYTYTHVGDQDGRWCVWAVDGAGNIGKKSDTWSFTFYTAVPEGQQPVAQPYSMAERRVTPTPAPTPLPPTPAPSVSYTPPPMATPAPVSSNYWSQPLPQINAQSQLIDDLKGTASRQNSSPTEGTQTPPAIQPTSPSSGARLSAYPCEVNLKWEPISDSGITYTVEVETIYPFEGGGSAGRSQFYRNLTQPSVTHRHPGDYQGQWRVWAVNASGIPGPASAWRTFSFETDGASDKKQDLSNVAGPVESMPEANIPSPLTQEVASVAPTLAAQSAAPAVTPRADVTAAADSDTSAVATPILESPRDGAIIDDDENYVICKWQGIEGSKFTLEVQSYDAATGQWSSELYKNLTSMKKTANHTAPLPGRWRVMATYQGADSPWSAWRYFSYHGQGKGYDGPEATSQPLPYAQLAPQEDTLPPDAPALVSPANNSTITSPDRRVDLTWSSIQDSSGVSYTCVIETPLADGQWQAHRFHGLQESKLTYQNPKSGNARWWVIATDGAGNSSQPSAVHQMNFDPQAPPASATPQPLAPTTGAAVAPGDVDLTWSASAPTTRVEVQVLEDRTVGGGQWKSAVNQDVNGTSITAQIQPGYEVRWRVGIIGPDGKFTGSTWQYFHTGK